MSHSYGKGNDMSAQKVKAIKLLVYDEQNVSALKIFTQEITESGQQKNAKETADNIYWISECLFRLKKFTFLDTLLQTGIPFTQNHKSDAFLKLKTIEAKYLIEKGNYKKAIQLLSELSSQIKDISQLCEIRLTLADANQRLQLLDQSKLHYDYVLKNATDIAQQARANNGLGSYYCILSDFDSAVIYYNSAFKQFQQELGEQHSRIGQVHYNLGLISDRRFDLYEAEQHFTKALQLYKNRLGDLHPRTAETYGSLGSLFFMKDNPGKALNYSIKEQDILLELYGKDNPDLAYSYLSCGKIFYLLGDKIQSEQQLLFALDLVKKYFGVNHNLYPQCVVELSKIYTERKQFSEAEMILIACIKLKQNDPDELLADLYLQFAQNYLQQHKTDKAHKHFALANRIYIRIYGDKNTHSVEAVLGLSDSYLQKGDFKTAYSYAKLAYAKTTQNNKITLPYDHWECLLHAIACKKELLTRNLIRHPDIKLYIENIKDVIREATLIKQTYYSTSSHLYYAERMAELNQLGIYYLTHFYNKTDTYFLDNLLFFAENNKANLLRNKIINYKATEILPLAEKAKSSVITGRLNYFISLNENQETTQYNINDSILFYQNLYETFSKSIEKKYPKIYRLKYGEKPLTAKQIQDKLDENQTFLEYISDNERYYLLAISKKNITYKICGDKQHIDSLISLQNVHTILQKSNSNINKQIAKHLLPTTMFKELIISPDGKIHFLAFDMLPTETEKLLVCEHPTQFAFSANTYFNHQPNNEKKNIFGFYPDFSNSSYAVLNSTKEHKALKLFSNYNVYHQQNATKSNFIKTANNTGIIHIASHLIIDTISPLYSYLVFQPSQNNTLSIHEIWKLSTNTQLISLACCHSNFGKQQSGEGVQNFAWAFHYAGAHNILSTQWNAPDKSTAAIISDFYRNLHIGIPKQEALRLAKISYLENSDAIGKEPYFWANLNLYGDKSAIVIHPYFFVKFWWIPVLVLLLCYLAIVTYNKLCRKKKYDHL